MCHLPGGTHANLTGWGFLALRLPLPEDKKWAEDRATIFQAVGALDPSGKPAPRLEAIKREKVIRLT